VFADIARFFGLQPIDWFGQYPLLSIIIIVAWQWLPFATLILLTALQSLDGEQKEAAEMDGAAASSTVHLHHPAAHGPRHHRGHPDPDDLPASASMPKSSSPPMAARATHHQPAFLVYRRRCSVRYRRRFGRRHHRGHPRQYRRLLPDARSSARTWRLEDGHGKVTTRSKVDRHRVAWIIGILIFFPILWTILTSFKSEPRRSRRRSSCSFRLDDGNYAEVQARANYFKPLHELGDHLGRLDADRA
jgi:hypothetical protein